MEEARPLPPTDEELVRRFQEEPGGPEGQAAAGELFARYRDRVYLWCFRRVHDHETALDLSQEVLISAYRSLAGFQARSLYSSWLYTIARHRCFRALRPTSLVRADDSELDELVDGEPSVQVSMETEEEREAVGRLMNETLSHEEQLALLLRCEEHLSVDEITRRLQLTSASGARGLLQGARRKLREAMAQRRRLEERRFS